MTPEEDQAHYHTAASKLNAKRHAQGQADLARAALQRKGDICPICSALLVPGLTESASEFLKRKCCQRPAKCSGIYRGHATAKTKSHVRKQILSDNYTPPPGWGYQEIPK